MKLLFGSDDVVAEWVRRHIPHMSGGSFGPHPVAIGVIGGFDGCELLGGVVFHDYRERFRTIEWSAASSTRNWLNRELITEIMQYPFGKLNCRKLRAVIPRRNEPARDFHKAFGFKQEGQLRREFGTDDACVYGLLHTEWRQSRFNLHRDLDGQVSSRCATAA